MLTFCYHHAKIPSQFNEIFINKKCCLAVSHFNININFRVDKRRFLKNENLLFSFINKRRFLSNKRRFSKYQQQN